MRIAGRVPAPGQAPFPPKRCASKSREKGRNQAPGRPGTRRRSPPAREPLSRAPESKGCRKRVRRKTILRRAARWALRDRVFFPDTAAFAQASFSLLRVDAKVCQQRDRERHKVVQHPRREKKQNAADSGEPRYR